MFDKELYIYWNRGYLRLLLFSITFFFFFLNSSLVFCGTYTVTTTVNGTTVDGASLRWAITQANATMGADLINFNIVGAGPHTIALTSELPPINDNTGGVTIDGFSQTGANANSISVFNATSISPMNGVYKIIITGLSGSTSWFKGLTINSNNNIIKGIVFKSFAGTSSSNYYFNPAIYITGNSNSVLGCYIGIAEDGTTKGGAKTGIGIYIDGTAASSGQNNLIGDGTVSGANLISGFNTHECIRIREANATGNRVRGNMIGLQKNGTTKVSGSTQASGVTISSSAYSNTIGGSTLGEGNIISGNDYGVSLNSSAISGNTILGNIIGPQADGISYVASNPQLRGIYIADSRNNTIGGSSVAARNIISANEQYGVFFQGTSSGNSVKGNYIGINKNGTAIISSSSQNYGVGVAFGTVGTNTIGGTAANEGNVISGNTAIGIWANYCVFSIYGNIIGPQADGVTLVTSNPQGYGLQIDGSTHTIGGNTALMRNIISGNIWHGIYISTTATGNVIMGNYIGPGSTLAAIAGSTQIYGVYIFNGSTNNTIGGIGVGEPNRIAFNTGDGIYILMLSCTGNLISGNPIYSNNAGGKPINLNYGASQGNNGKAIPVITTSNTSTIAGTSGANNVIEVFKNTTGSSFDASTYVGTTTANGSGNWSLAVSLTAGDVVIANARDASNNTSEFSTPTFPLPVELLYFTVECDKEGAVQCKWSTVTETNNNFFTIERSLDSVSTWEVVGQIKGAGNSSQALQYTFTHKDAIKGNSFYRLKQTDFNGQYEYYKPVAIQCGNDNSVYNIYPNPTNGSSLNMELGGENGKEILVLLYDVNGKETYSKLLIKEDKNNTIYTIDLTGKVTPGIYFITATSYDKTLSKKLIVK